MTDRIDLDDLETGGDGDDAESGNRGDWLWRDDGDESSEPSTGPDDWEPSATSTGEEPADGDDAADGSETDEPGRARAPHVPKPGQSTPVGIPSAGDGNGSTASAADSTEEASAGGSEGMRPMGAGTTESNAAAETQSASGPHGGGADDMTMAITYGALNRLEQPAAVFADAAQWSDWVGIVGDVPAHVIQKFQRDRGIDVDFFNGTGTGPGERLAEIDRNSMFYADRMVVVGREEADEPIAEAAEWEFVPLETAAAKADWRLEDGDA